MQQLNSHGSQPEVTGSRSTESKGDDMTVLLGLEAHGAAVDAHAPFVSPVAAQSPNPQALLKTTPSPSVRTAAPAPPPTASTSHAVTGLCTSASPAADVLPASAAPGALMPPPSPPAAATAAAGGRPAMGGGGALLSEGYAYEEAPPDEERECGAVSRPVYDFYLSAVGWGLVGLVLGSLVAMQGNKDVLFVLCRRNLIFELCAGRPGGHTGGFLTDYAACGSERYFLCLWCWVAMQVCPDYDGAGLRWSISGVFLLLACSPAMSLYKHDAVTLPNTDAHARTHTHTHIHKRACKHTLAHMQEG
eukprot:scaffold11643_cov20-Tisochrysis_lutea.AAC.1